MSKQMKTSQGEAEVFVLSPNLLEKLGINLCNITQNAQQFPEPERREKNKHSLEYGSYSNHEGIKSSVFKLQKKNDESSILETANLMKKSVFLSPTFIPMVVNAIPGEVDIVKNVESHEDLITSTELNAGGFANDSNSNKDTEYVEQVKPPYLTLDSKEHEIPKKKCTSLICNGNGLLSDSKKRENDLSNGIQINSFVSDRTESNTTKVNCIEDMEVSCTTQNMKDNIHFTSTKHKIDDSQMSKIFCDLYANSRKVNHEISTENKQDISLSNNCNKDNNNASGIVIDKDISIQKYSTNNNGTILEIDEALVIPLSMIPESTSNFNVNDLNGDEEDVNIDLLRSLNEQEIDELETPSKKHKICKSTDVEETNDVNIDIIKYTECDDCSDMELENMLHETELLVPTSSTTEEMKSSHNEVIHIVDKGVNYTNSQKDVRDENDLCNSNEDNRILISILPELMDTSSLDLFCEQNINDVDMGNANKNEKLTIPIADTNESGEHINSNEINMDSTTYFDCNGEKSDKSHSELYNILRETNILISLSLPSESNNSMKISNIADTENELPCNQYGVRNGNEAEKELQEDNVCVQLSVKSPAIIKKYVTDQISENKMVINHIPATQIDDSFEYKHSSNRIEVNNEIINCKQNDLLCNVSDHVTHSLLIKNISVPHIDNLCIESNHVSITRDEDENKNCNKNNNVIITLEQTNQNNKKDCFLNEYTEVHAKNKHKCDREQTAPATAQTVQNNNICFDSEIDRVDKVNKSHKAEFAKNVKDKSDENVSFRKQIETNNFKDKSIFYNQHNTSKQLNVTPHSFQNNHVDNIEDKVQEIAVYLKQVIQNNNKRRHNSKRGIKILKPKTGSLTKSKIFIQGVEKPGGSEECKISFDKQKCHKTYTRKEKQVKLNVATIFGTASLKDVTKPEENCTEINICIEQTHSPKKQEYCLCGDFGKFKFYDDSINSYEHIHFGSNKSVNCPVETVLEIYNDENSIVYNTEQRENTQDKNCSSEYDEDCHICWQAFEYQDYKMISTETKSATQIKCVEDADLKLEILTKSNLPVIQKGFETASELETTGKTQDTGMCAGKLGSSEMCDTSLTEVIVEVDCEISSSLSSSSSTATSHAHIEYKDEEDNKVQLTCETINESAEIERHEESRIHIESKDVEDNRVQQTCETLDESVEIERHEVFHIHIEPKEEKDNKVQQTCETINESVKIETHETSHIHIEPKDEEDNKIQQACKTMEIETHEISDKGKEDNKEQQSCEDKSVEMAADTIIDENYKGNKTKDSKTEGLKNSEKCSDHLKSRKRKIKIHIEEPPTKKSDKCGVCKQVFAHSEWEEHISTVHCYIAWKDGQTIDFDNLLLLKKLKKKLKSNGSLVCSLCAFKNAHLEKFLSHVKKCVANGFPKSNIDENKESKVEAATSKSGISKCGVCHLEVDDVNWIGHISEQHQYLAWKAGEPPLDTSDENAVKTHLLNLVKIYGQLLCTKCGLLRKYTPKSIKSYLAHIQKCENNNANKSRRSIGKAKSSPSSNACKCAVCGAEVDASKWFEHIGQEHNYRAWRDGDMAPNLENKIVLWEHLNEISKKAEGLHCSKCGVVRRYVKPFLQHIDSCTGIAEGDVSNCDIIKEQNDLNSIESPETSTKTDAPNSTSTPKTSRKKVKSSGMSKTCGVCKEVVEDSAWIDHIGKAHNYLAWIDGETPLETNNQEAVWQHLHDIVSTAGKLECAKCGKFRKYPKSYLHHISDCLGQDASVVDESTNASLNYSVISHVDRSLKGQNLSASTKEVKCGVCQAVVGREAWMAHIQIDHGYLAWIDGETPLDTNNDAMILEHLQQIIDEVGSLVCSKCGTSRKYAKKFWQHMEECVAKESSRSSQSLSPYEWALCGACKQTVQINQWFSHMWTVHNYLAWRQGQVALRGPAQIKKRLNTIIDKLGELICPKCGYKDKNAELYLQHSETCKGSVENETKDDEATMLARQGFYRCALCLEKVKFGEWRQHSLSKHYTVAWVIGDEPIDIFNQNEIAKIMKEYMPSREFVCKVCGISRSSGLGFFAHVLSCSLKEEESDRFKITCEICNSKYPGFYKSQHMAAHGQQVLAKQIKEIAQEDREREKQRKLDELVPSSGRRRAAEKARMVIEETVSQFKHVCQSCAFATDAEVDMLQHKCPKGRKMSEDLDISLEQEESSEDEAFPDIDEVSDEDDDDSKSDTRKRPDHSCSARITRIPFVVSNVEDYIAKNLKDYTKNYLTTATLFPEWTKCHFEAVTGDELSEYLPPLEESCQVHSNENWRTYKRWEAVVENQKTTIFVGVSVQRISWLPALAVAERPVHILAVAGHSVVGCSVHRDDLPEHKALVQFWDFGDFKTEPKLVFGLALHHGTVWGMDWCPSGAREPPPDGAVKGFVRMGLLAVACSNGMAYIYSVPYPSSVVTSDSIIYKLEHVAQLKFTMKSDRRLYQATSICWSQQKGHGTVIVGYADGSTAYYDLETESPFLKSQIKNVTIFYPYYDERTHIGSVTDLDTFPMARASSATGAVCAASPTGSVLRSGGARGARLHSHLASAAARFMPAWPAALFAGEDILTNLAPAELEYWGMGRRLGFLQNCCSCLHCARVATFMAPFLRVLRPHYARTDLKKQVVAWIGIKQLAKKRKHNEDKPVVKMEEALTYEEAVTKYGIQFKLIDKQNCKEEYIKAMSQYKEVNPECFPISEVPSMAFCPSAKYHRHLAVATHAGLIFVVYV